MTEPLRLVVLVLSLALTGVAHAQPLLRVRAETRLELTRELTGTGVRLRGTLLDDLGQPLASRDVALEISSGGEEPTSRTRVRTDREGRFVVALPLEEDQVVRARAIFGGDEGHERLEVERVVDRRRADVRLRLALDANELSLDAPTHRVRVRAESSAGGAGLELELLDELGRSLGVGTTDADGRLELEVRSESLGGPGAGRLALRTDGDTTRAPGRTEIPIVRTRASTIDLTSPDRVAVGASTRLSGRLRDVSGPLPERAIGIFANGEHRGSVLTRADGAFEWTLDVAREDAPSLELVARYESDEPGHPSSESAPITLRVDVPAATSGWALLAVALCAVAIWLARSLWRREVVVARPVRPPASPVELGKPRRGRERSTVISGRLEDREARALRGRVVARGVDGSERSLDTDTDARFELELTAGTWEVRFEAPGHAIERVTATLPHRGDWTGVTVRLESWRHRAWAILRSAVERAGLPGWERSTIREVVAPADATLRSLGGAVERAVYDRSAPDADAIAELETRAKEVRSLRARTGR